MRRAFIKVKREVRTPESADRGVRITVRTYGYEPKFTRGKSSRLCVNQLPIAFYIKCYNFISGVSLLYQVVVCIENIIVTRY